MKRKVKPSVYFMPILAAAIILQALSCSNGNSNLSGPDQAILKAEKPFVDTSRVPELIELYRAKRYESIQEGLAAGPDNVIKMSLHGKKIGSLSPEIKNFTYLATLDIADNDLASLPPELSDMHYLQSFYANGNRLTEFPGQLLLLPVLVRLDLSANQVSVLPAEIMKMDQLTSLNLEANLLTSIPVQLYELSNLEVLNLAKNGLSTVPDGISDMKNLKRLDLSNNQLAAIPREVASLSGTLIELSIQGNQIPMDQIDWFIEAMPNTEIRF